MNPATRPAAMDTLPTRHAPALLCRLHTAAGAAGAAAPVLRHHERSCARCATSSRAVALLGGQAQAPVPTGLLAGVLHAVADEPLVPSRPREVLAARSPHRRWALAVAGVAAAAAVAAGVALSRRPGCATA